MDTPISATQPSSPETTAQTSTPATTVRSIALVDPRTGRVRGTVQGARKKEVAAAVAAARTAAHAWRERTPRDRSRRLERLATLVEEHAAEYVAREQAGTGKPAAEAVGEVEQVADLFRFYASAARTQLVPASGRLVAGHESWVRWEPVGVVGVIVPWNYPLMMTAWRGAPALAAGNTVVVKPAETTPDSLTLFAEHAADALGDAVLQTLPGDRKTGRLLVEADIDMVAFTGSKSAGADVVARAGIRRASLELGGNAPALVLPDAPDDTWAELARACTYNAGQSCAAPARVITLRENYETAVERLSAAMAQRLAGRDFGPLNNADQAARYDRIVAASRAGRNIAAEIAPGSGEEGGVWRAARVLADVPDDDPAVVDEVFGPLLTVQWAAGLDAAIDLANGVPQALAASVWTRDVGTGLDVAGRLNAGEAWLNCHLVQTAELPHSGRGASGHGTDLSVLALHEYQRPKTITARLLAGPASMER
ncbi:aldehyde dehydrogenase family protein [Streptomyces zagrosensis]|uniref:Acyl-CoA reductase-like NAD-dependent aldehyde dehydrogenase n=1 Tax=Streptomyces zagrosensis TaxID=1042984 RepID=A0A7W9V2W9_9ACTN|nr:aldehyde dehydrogenase family protein [Streptomyces zagrosensis]MBB5939721.1 acyl-CoA reductase-like NAD-dependent aldehyde dehydrogenase [Streptomyces zagrosensis]